MTEVVQPVDDFVESIHSQNGFSRDRMSAEAARAFDAEVRASAGPFLRDGGVPMRVAADVAWGRPL